MYPCYLMVILTQKKQRAPLWHSTQPPGTRSMDGKLIHGSPSVKRSLFGLLQQGCGFLELPFI